MKLFLRFFSLSFLVVLTSQKLFAWGSLGHQTSAQIALKILTQQNSPALVQIKNILQDDDFVESSIWADEIKTPYQSPWTHANWYHFEKIPNNESYFSHLKLQTPDVLKKGGAIEAILKSEQVLSDPKIQINEKKFALKFLIHFVSDIHQPLHTGPADDSGGNKTMMDWNGFQISLHQAWDSQIMALGHKEFFKSGTQSEQIEKFAQYIIQSQQNLFSVDQNKLDYQDWIYESLLIRNDIYLYKNESAASYTHRFLPEVDSRLYRSGLRLAFLLNKVFPGYKGPQQPTSVTIAKSQSFISELNKIVGSFSDIIDLKPR